MTDITQEDRELLAAELDAPAERAKNYDGTYALHVPETDMNPEIFAALRAIAKLRQERDDLDEKVIHVLDWLGERGLSAQDETPAAITDQLTWRDNAMAATSRAEDVATIHRLLSLLKEAGEVLVPALINAAVPLEAINMVGNDLMKFHPDSWAEIQNAITHLRKASALVEKIKGLGAYDSPMSSPSAASVPSSGWQLVPKEPTDDMVEAYHKCEITDRISPATAEEVWTAMIAAAPNKETML